LAFYGEDLYIDNIRVHQKRQGYGTRLVMLALDHAKEIGFDRVHLFSLPTKEAVLFWESFGLGKLTLFTKDTTNE
jgi:GNAT superfamily N-acetyltransferase